MIKEISLVRRGLVIEGLRFEKSHIKGWVSIFTKKGDLIGGFTLLDSKLKVIHKFQLDDTLFLTYALIKKEVKQ